MLKKLQFDPGVRSDFRMIGISCHLKDYRLSYHLNRSLGLKLKKMEDLKVQGDKDGAPGAFSFYFFDHADQLLLYYLLGNRSQDQILLQEQKEADYFLLLRGSFRGRRVESILKAVRQAPNVLTAYEADLTGLKNVHLLLSEIELQAMENLKIFRKSR